MTLHFELVEVARVFLIWPGNKIERRRVERDERLRGRRMGGMEGADGEG